MFTQLVYKSILLPIVISVYIFFLFIQVYAQPYNKA